MSWPLASAFNADEASYLVVLAANARELEKLHEIIAQSPELENILYRVRDQVREKSSKGAISQLAFSRREMEVAELICLRLSNKEIGRALGLSHFTIRNYVSQLLRKLNLPSRLAVITLLNQLRNEVELQKFPKTPGF